MTFHDVIEADFELSAMRAVVTLQMWLATLAPVKSTTSREALMALHAIAKELEWKTTRDVHLGLEVVDVKLYNGWFDKELFEKQGARVIGWLSSEKGFKDMTTELLFFNDQWHWADTEEPVKRVDLIMGVKPYPEPPVEFSNE